MAGSFLWCLRFEAGALCLRLAARLAGSTRMNLGLSLRSTPTRSAARSPVCATPRSEEEDDRLTGEFERKVNLQER